MQASIVFIPGICSDDGRAYTGWWNVYTRENPNAFWWNEPKIKKTLEEALDWCEEMGYTVIKTAST